MASRRRLPTLVTALAATLSLAAVAACGSDSAPDTAADGDVVTTAAPATPTATQPVGSATTGQAGDGAGPVTTADGGDETRAAPEAMQFQAPLLGGGTFDGAAYGERPVVFWFWAPT